MVQSPVILLRVNPGPLTRPSGTLSSQGRGGFQAAACVFPVPLAPAGRGVRGEGAGLRPATKPVKRPRPQKIAFSTPQRRAGGRGATNHEANDRHGVENGLTLPDGGLRATIHKANDVHGK